MLTSDTLRRLAPRLPLDKAKEYAPLLEAALTEFEIDGPLRRAAFFAQVLLESQELTRWEENLNYSASRLRVVFPRYFATADLAVRYARRPAAIASRVYGGRMGNGPESTGDGWRFRGRCPMQATGREMYRSLSLALGGDYLSDPDLLLEPKHGFRAAAWIFAVEKGCNPLADQGTEAAVAAISRRINGGTNGLAERLDYYRRARQVLASETSRPASTPPTRPALKATAAVGGAVVTTATLAAVASQQQAVADATAPVLALGIAALVALLVIGAVLWAVFWRKP